MAANVKQGFDVIGLSLLVVAVATLVVAVLTWLAPGGQYGTVKLVVSPGAIWPSGRMSLLLLAEGTRLPIGPDLLCRVPIRYSGTDATVVCEEPEGRKEFGPRTLNLSPQRPFTFPLE